jgi:hypothetical protein
MEIALDKIEPIAGAGKILPVVITGMEFSALPEILRYKNGLFLDGHTVRSVAWTIAKRAFPGRAAAEAEMPWKHPIPGEWLEISGLDSIVEQYFDIGDKLYFRSISPMGLFECYSRKLGGLFWIAPDNVRTSTDLEANKELEAQIPTIFRVSAMVEIQRLGWQAWNARNKK